MGPGMQGHDLTHRIGKHQRCDHRAMRSQSINHALELARVCDGAADDEAVFSRHAIYLYHFRHFLKELVVLLKRRMRALDADYRLQADELPWLSHV